MVKKAVVLLIIMTIFFVSFGQAANRKQNGWRKPVGLKKYEIYQYVSINGYSPKSVIDIDNNGEILFACIAGTSRKQLKNMGFRFAESQILLLENMNLLREDEKGILKTAFPILNSNQVDKLRGHTKKAAIVLGDSLRENIVKLKHELASINREQTAYTVLFSYVLDDLVWRIFEEKQLVKENKIIIEEPFWSGVVWALYPPRPFDCGTNSVSNGGFTIQANWSRNVLKKMSPFVNYKDLQILEAMVGDFAKNGKVQDKEAIKKFSEFNIIDSKGRFTVPIIDENSSLYEKCSAIAQDVAGQVPVLLDLKSITSENNFRNEQVAMVVVYHELMWDLLDYLDGQHVIEKPLAFAKPEKALAADIGDLIFLVKEKPGTE